MVTDQRKYLSEIVMKAGNYCEKSLQNLTKTTEFKF